MTQRRSRADARRRELIRLLLLLAAIFVTITAASPNVDARPGGGQSFGGSSKSSSGSSTTRPSSGGTSRSDDGWSDSPGHSASSSRRDTSEDALDDSTGRRRYRSPPGSLVEHFVYLVIAMVVSVVSACVRGLVRLLGEIPWTAGSAKPVDFPPPKRATKNEIREAMTVSDVRAYASIQAALGAIAAEDQAFSFIVFEDFLYALYATIHTLRGTANLAWAEPYLGEEARGFLESRSCDAVRDIVVGGMRIVAIEVDGRSRTIRVQVVFTANYTEMHGESPQSQYVEEEWTLAKNVDLTSRAPAAARVIGCQECGAPLDQQVAAKCSHCGTPAANELGWRVVRLDERERQERPPMLTGTTEERGNELATVVAPDLDERLAELSTRDPSFSWTGLVVRVEQIFRAFHGAWAARDLTEARPFLSGSLLETQRYWVDAYHAAGLVNVLRDPTIVAVHPARVTRDKYFESITVRLRASSFDSTVDESGAVVGGDPEVRRIYTEYWTLIRGVRPPGRPFAEPACPECGAPISHVEQSGKCESCGVTITMGSFDWVLSRIEQDEVYAG